MKKSIKNNISPILKHTKFIGSVKNKIIHSTEKPCAEVYKIEPNDRWYIVEIPNDGNYSKCSLCFPNAKK